MLRFTTRHFRRWYRSEWVVAKRNCSRSNNPELEDKDDERRGPSERLQNIRQWRQSWTEKPEGFVMILEAFRSMHEPNRGLLEALAGSDLPFRNVADMWRKLNLRRKCYDQEYRQDRVNALGVDLAAAHFLIYRGGKVKFHNMDDWIWIEDRSQPIPLPNSYTKGYCLEAIDCEYFLGGTLRYEALSNFEQLETLKSLSLKGNLLVDDWCLDKISYILPDLEHLNISGCFVTHRGLVALYRLENLKTLILSSAQFTKEMEITCSMLEKLNPHFLLKVEEP